MHKLANHITSCPSPTTDHMLAGGNIDHGIRALPAAPQKVTAGTSTLRMDGTGSHQRASKWHDLCMLSKERYGCTDDTA